MHVLDCIELVFVCKLHVFVCICAYMYVCYVHK